MNTASKVLFALCCVIAFFHLAACAQAPVTNKYTLSAAGGAPFSIDDDLDVSINGNIVFTDGTAASTTSHPPVTFSAKQGDTLATTVRDTYGFCTGVSPLYLSCGPSSTPVLADPGLVEFCGRPSGNQGISHSATFTIPAMSCVGLNIAAVEFTQAIQQYQILADLQASLTANGEPPVPIIAGKPGVMRVYFPNVTTATDVILTITGAINDSKTASLQPNCQPTDQRAGNSGCQSMDFFFTPPAGSWTVTLTLTDTNNVQLDQQTLNVTSRTTNAVNLKSVKACDTTTGSNVCGSPSGLSGQTQAMLDLMPTATVTVQSTWSTVLDALSNYAYDVKGWDASIAKKADALYTAADQTTDFGSNQRTTYFAVNNPNFGVIHGVAFTDYSAWAAGIPSHGAMGPNKAIYLGMDDTPGTVAHEVAHTLNLQHTNLLIPAGIATASPGCFGLADSPGTYWHYPTNQIQSTGVLENGYNVTTHTIIDPTNTYDLMSYCLPQWISPVQYKRLVTTLGGGAVTSPSIAGPVTTTEQRSSISPEAGPIAHASPTVVAGPYWQIAGTIDPVAGVIFNPVFKDTIAGTPDPGTGTYSIRVLGSAGQTLYTRNFTPQTAEGDTGSGATVDSTPYFSQWVPVTAGAVSFGVFNSGGVSVGTLAITGSTPTVTISSPVAGFVGSGASQTVSWTVSGTTVSSPTARIEYSPDGGTTWIPLGDTPGTTATVDFTDLPGSTNAMIRVLVSDGVNTGSATSVPFPVNKKTPSYIAIMTPVMGYAQAGHDPVYLSGSAYDADDGFLKGSALKWSSNVQGILGSGSPLSVILSPGTHALTLTGTDSDGNAISTTTTVLIGGARPTVSLATAALTSSCTSATVSASPGAQGAALSLVQYSLDGGATYSTIALGKLPYSFVVPGSGAVNVVARAYDATNQSAATSSNLTLASACITGSPAITGGGTQSAGIGTAFASALALKVQDAAGNAVPGATVNFAPPVSGASATLSAASVQTATDGTASVSAIANSTPGSYNVVATVAGFSSAVTYNLSNIDFSIAVDSTTIDVKHGSSATANFTLTPLGGMASAITLSCGTLPPGVTCSFNPASVTPNGSAAATSVLTISATNSAKASAQKGAFGAAFLFCLFVATKRRRSTVKLISLAVALTLLGGAIGCGGNFNPFSSAVTVTAASGGLSHTQTITVNIK